MDCRHAWVGFVIVALAAGCNRESRQSGAGPTPQMIGKSKTESEPAVQTVAAKGKDRRREPKAETCAAFGQLRLQMASEPDRTPLEKQQFYDEARKAYQQALTLDPKHMASYRGLAQVYSGQGDHERAVSTFRKAIEMKPDDHSLHFALGLCHSRAKNWQAALDSIHKALQLDPENRQYGHFYGYGLARAGAYDQALSVFTRLDGEAKAHYNLGRMLAHLNEKELARRHIELALKKEPELAGARSLLTGLDAPTDKGVRPVVYESPEEAEPKP